MKDVAVTETESSARLTGIQALVIVEQSSAMEVHVWVWCKKGGRKRRSAR